MDDADANSLAVFFSALCDPTRLKLLSLMADGPVSVGFLADAIRDSQPKVSRHLAFLRSAELVTTARRGKNIYYELCWPGDSRQANVISAILGESQHPEGGVSISPDIYGYPDARPQRASDMDASLGELEIYLL